MKQKLVILVFILVFGTVVIPIESKEIVDSSGQLGIHSISGGFGVTANIDNNGDTLQDVSWEIEFEAFVLINRVSNGTIANFPDHSSKKVSTGFLFGLSPGFVRVNVWKDDDSVHESRNCFVLGPFVLILE